jgi:hypothetical protein
MQLKGLDTTRRELLQEADALGDLLFEQREKAKEEKAKERPAASGVSGGLSRLFNRFPTPGHPASSSGGGGNAPSTQKPITLDFSRSQPLDPQWKVKSEVPYTPKKDWVDEILAGKSQTQ